MKLPHSDPAGLLLGSCLLCDCRMESLGVHEGCLSLNASCWGHTMRKGSCFCGFLNGRCAKQEAG